MKKISFIWLWVLLPTLAFAEKSAIEARQDGNNLVVESPYGKKIFFGPLGFDEAQDFQVAIPLQDLLAKEATNSGASPPVFNFKTDVDALLLRANEAYQEGEAKNALALVEQTLEISPNNVRALMMRGSLSHVLGDRTQAKKSWEQALSLDPANSEIKRILEKYQ